LVLRMNSPIQGFANVLGALTRNLVVALEEVRKKKQPLALHLKNARTKRMS